MPIRLKIAVVSTIATLVLLGGAGLLFLTTLRSGLENSLDNALRSRSDDLTSQVNPDGSLRDASAGRLRLADNGYGQVLTADGAIVDSTDDLLSAPMLTPDQVLNINGATKFLNVSVPEQGTPDHYQQLRVLAVPINGTKSIAVVGISRDVVDEAIERAGKQLLILGAIVIVIAAPGSWLLVRGALGPVERMRSQAADLQAQDAGGGLSVPATRDEIARLATTFNALLARLHSALERERAFVADAGHELRTPLTVLRGELELAQRPGRSKTELEATVQVAAEETDRLIRLAEDLLVLARDETAGGLRWEDFDLADLVATVCTRLESPAAERQVRLEQATPATLVVGGDSDRIRQAIDNVMTNALRFAPADSSITLRASRDPGWATVEITDHGPGFADDILPDAFERFRRADHSRGRAPSDTEGAGLGLAIVRNVLRSHGGDAVAANLEDGSGARVTMRWPTTAPRMKAV